MRKTTILVFFALSMIAQSACAWWAAAARGIEPIILSFGAAFAAIGLNDQTHSYDDLKLSKSKEWFKNKFEILDPSPNVGWTDKKKEDEERRIYDKAKDKYTDEWVKEYKRVDKQFKLDEQSDEGLKNDKERQGLH